MSSNVPTILHTDYIYAQSMAVCTLLLKKSKSNSAPPQDWAKPTTHFTSHIILKGHAV